MWAENQKTSNPIVAEFSCLLLAIEIKIPTWRETVYKYLQTKDTTPTAGE